MDAETKIKFAIPRTALDHGQQKSLKVYKSQTEYARLLAATALGGCNNTSTATTQACNPTAVASGLGL